MLEKNKDVRVITSTTPNQYVFRMNWLQPPFNNVKIRQAVTYALSQEEFLQANVGDKRFYRVCKAMFTCDTPLATTAGMDGLIEGNVAKARELLKEAGYDGTVVVIPQPTDLGVHQAARTRRQVAAREGRLQGRGPADGLAEHGDQAHHQERVRLRKAAGTPSARAGRSSTSSTR